MSHTETRELVEYALRLPNGELYRGDNRPFVLTFETPMAADIAARLVPRDVLQKYGVVIATPKVVTRTTIHTRTTSEWADVPATPDAGIASPDPTDFHTAGSGDAPQTS